MPGLLLRRSTSNSRPSFSSASPSPSSSPPPTLHRRRLMSRSNTSSPPPPAVSGLGLPAPLLFNTAAPNKTQNMSKSKRERQMQRKIERFDGDEIESLDREESDTDCWLRMLALQKQFHCYNSARLEAAVEALDRGCSIEEVSIPSRLCLDLLNEGLRAQMSVFSGLMA